MEALNQALSISPNKPAAYLYLALVNIALDNAENAQTQISKAIGLIDNLPDEEKNLLFLRVSTDLETFAKNNPDAADDVEQLLNLLSEQ
jgi:tetratricopeptide (TPR) repeat protein